MERLYISAEHFSEIVGSPEYEDRSIELVEGELVEMSKAGGLHGQITMLLSLKIANYVVDNGLGIVTSAETGFILERNPDGKDTVRALDIAFLSGSRVSAVLPDHLVDVAPDLAVEVISPSNITADTHRKVRQLLARVRRWFGLSTRPSALSKSIVLPAPQRWRATTCSTAAMSCRALQFPSARFSPLPKLLSVHPQDDFVEAWRISGVAGVGLRCFRQGIAMRHQLL